MRFLEKDLETIIYENYDACWEYGLDISQIEHYPGHCGRYRQLRLGPYGVADLVNINIEHREREVVIQVIECKREVINLDTYKQAKRYVTALMNLLREKMGLAEEDWQISVETVLIGRRVEQNDGFIFVYNDDPRCKAFTYDYSVDGLAFTVVPKTWRYSKAMDQTATEQFLAPYKKVMGQWDDAVKHMREVYTVPEYTTPTPYAGGVKVCFSPMPTRHYAADFLPY